MLSLEIETMFNSNYFPISLITCLVLSACGGGSSDSNAVTPQPEPVAPQDPITSTVSFAVSDAPVDGVISVNVTFDSITLKPDSDADDGDIVVPVLDDDGNPTTMTINLMDYQDGESKLLIENAEVAIGDYSNMTINTFGCPQNQNGSTEFCWVEDNEGIKTLKTPSNKLRLGAITISEESEQAYNIEFNLRASMTSTANGASYNLKPHGIRVTDDNLTGSVFGLVDVNLLNAGEGCEAVYQDNSDHGKVVYLYEQALIGDNTLADEFDPEEAQNPIPEGLVAPLASDLVVFDNDDSEYKYHFSHLEAGVYVVAFSCSATDDDPSEYNAIMIANPEEQLHEVTVVAGEVAQQDFSEQ
jgi:hypothetical protein